MSFHVQLRMKDKHYFPPIFVLIFVFPLSCLCSKLTSLTELSIYTTSRTPLVLSPAEDISSLSQLRTLTLAHVIIPDRFRPAVSLPSMQLYSLSDVELNLTVGADVFLQQLAAARMTTVTSLRMLSCCESPVRFEDETVRVVCMYDYMRCIY